MASGRDLFVSAESTTFPLAFMLDALLRRSPSIPL